MNVPYIKISEEISSHVFEFIVVTTASIEDEATNIINKLSNEVWLSKIENEVVSESFKVRLKETLEHFKDKINGASNDNEFLQTIAEKIVTVNATGAIEQVKGFKSLPIGDTFRMQKDRNPGFDYYNECNLFDYFIVFGEGKYLSNTISFNNAIKQVLDFIEEKHDYADVADLRGLVSERSLNNFVNRRFSFGFSIPADSSLSYEEIYNHILENEHFKTLISKFNVIGVGVVI